MNILIDQNPTFGAFAIVRIQFEGTIEQLASELAKVLNLHDFRVEPDEYPPHEMVGMAETLGWEVWLNNDSRYSKNIYRLHMETENSFTESSEDRNHDLSPWLARFLAIHEIEAVPDSRRIE